MTDQSEIAGDGAQETKQEDENPFEGFQTEGFEEGEPSATQDPPPAGSDEGAGDDDDDDSGSDESGDESGDRSRSKGKQTAQERINELTRLRREEERRADALEKELRELREAAAARKAAAEAEEQASKGTKAKQPGGEKPKGDGPPDPDQFDYGELDPRYIRALASYETRQEIQKIRAEEAEEEARRAALAAQEEARRKFEQQIENGSKKHEDFYEKVIVGAEKGEWALSEHLGQLLADSDVGDDIAYHLASHPEEAAQVFRQTPLEQARYFGRMEAKFTADQSAAAGNAGKTGETRTPKAPPPVTPARGSDGRFSPSASTDDFAAFEAHANSQ